MQTVKTTYNQLPMITGEHEAFIVQSLACGMSAIDVTAKMILFFDEFDEQHDKKLLLKIMRVGRSKKFIDYIRSVREGWEKECLDIPIAIRKIRLQMLWDEYHRIPKESLDKVIITPSGDEIHVYKQNTNHVLKIIEQARQEITELTRPSRDAPKGKKEDALQINMTDGNMFGPESDLSNTDDGVPV